jgi:hypothetical protein
MLAVMLVLLATTALADRDDHWERGYGPNLLLINPGDLFNGVVSLEYERALGPWFGISLGVSVWAFHGLFQPMGDPSYLAVGPELAAKFHFIRDAPGGLWLGPTVNFNYVISTSTGALSRPWSWGLGAAIGYNFIIGDHFTFQIGGGGQFVDYGDRLVWVPRLLLGLGSAF